MIEFTLAPLPRGYFYLLIPIAFVLLKNFIYLLTKSSKNESAARISEFIRDELMIGNEGWIYNLYFTVSCLCAGLFVLIAITYYPLRSEAVKKFNRFDAYKERIESRKSLSHEILLQAERYNVWMEDAVDGHNKNFTVKHYDFKPIDMKALWEKHGGNKCCAIFEELRDKW